MLKKAIAAAALLGGGFAAGRLTKLLIGANKAGVLASDSPETLRTLIADYRAAEALTADDEPAPTIEDVRASSQELVEALHADNARGIDPVTLGVIASLLSRAEAHRSTGVIAASEPSDD